MPSTKLNDSVNLLTDGEFADFLALYGDGGKDFAWRKLCKWHRGRCPSDPDEEKLAFQEYDLKSLRKKALQEIEFGIVELRTDLPRELKPLRYAIAKQSLTELGQVMAQTQELKAHALQRGYFERHAKILDFEKCLVELLCEGKRLQAELKRLEEEEAQSKANIILAAEIAYYHAEYFIRVKQEQQRTGLKNEVLISAYESSDFASKDVSTYPSLLACNKWKLDVYFHDIRRKFLEARMLDEKVFQHNRQVSILSPKEHCLLLSRLAIYYSTVGDQEKARAVIGFFEEIDPEKEEHRRIYLKRYLVSMFLVAFDGNDKIIEERTMEVFHRNEAIIISSVQDNDWLLILIFVMTYFLARHEGAKAKRIFDMVYKVKDQKPPLQYRIQYMVAHLMILFELNEQGDMKVFAKNYQEFFKLHPIFAAPALAVLSFLRGNVKHQFPIKVTNKLEAKKETKRVTMFNSKIDDLLASLREYEVNTQTSSSFWYIPFYKWIGSKRLKTVEYDDLSDSIPHPKSQDHRGGGSGR